MTCLTLVSGVCRYYFCQVLYEVQSTVMSEPLCLLAYLWNHMAELYQILGLLTVTITRSSCMLCTSGFVDDVTFSHTGSCGTSCLAAGQCNSQNCCIDSNQTLLYDSWPTAHRVCMVHWRERGGVKCAMCNCVVLS